MERKPGESINDRNDRAIRLATSWYNEHLTLSEGANEKPVKALLLTDDIDNYKKACEDGIPASTGR